MTQTRSIDTMNRLTSPGRARTVEVGGGGYVMSQWASAEADLAVDDIIIQEGTGTSATAGTISRNHYYGGFTIGATVSTAAKYQTFTDHLGHVREVVAITTSSAAPTGTVVTRYDYTAYQGPQKVYQHPGTNIEATFQTIGRYYHHEASGLELALYRGYDAELGRWISEDPIEDAETLPDGPNIYSFARISPVSRVDDLGGQTDSVSGNPGTAAAALHGLPHALKLTPSEISAAKALFGTGLKGAQCISAKAARALPAETLRKLIHNADRGARLAINMMKNSSGSQHQRYFNQAAEQLMRRDACKNALKWIEGIYP